MAGTNITLQTEVGRELLPSEADDNIRELDSRTGTGWKDLVGNIMPTPTANPVTQTAFGPSGLRSEAAFDIGNYANVSPFHINHDVKVGGKAYAHIHWSTDGIDTNSVKWEFQISRALGHDQDFFPAATSYFVEQQPNQVASGAWRHYIAEVGDIDALTLIEPDELILITVRRVTNGAVDNTDTVFGIIVDFHYEADKSATLNKAPDFYV